MAESGAGHALVVGRITGCYGIRGWVRIHPYTESPEDFLALGGWQLRGRDGLRPLEFDDGRTHGKGLVAHIAGVDDRSRAASLSGLEVVVRRDALPSLEAGDYYWCDLQGLQVWCRDGSHSVLLGTAERLIETGANDVLVVMACAGSVDDRERLIPYLPGQTVSDVDLEAGRIEVDWFLDEY